MASIYAYLTFNGNCREAMQFYNECLGGEVTTVPLKGSPMENQVPPGSEDRLMHSALVSGKLILYGSDYFGEEEYKPGNNLSLDLECDSEQELREYFGNLSRGGKVTMPLSNPFWGGLFGQFIDKFGFNWMLMYQPKGSQ